jgi:hypothetical protein
MFGTMIEYVLTTFSSQHAAELPVKSDGSMHDFRKQWHPNSSDKLIAWPDSGITTPIYPFQELHLPEILERFQEHYLSWNQDRKVLIYAPDLTWCEINLLFQYHKISQGLDLGLDIFLGSDPSMIKKWEPNAESWHDLKPWQWREWFSIFYPEFVQEWIQSPQHVDDTWLCVANRDMLQDTEKSLALIADHCDVELVRPIQEFCQEYIKRQYYIIREHDTINHIFNAVISDSPMTWKPLSIVAEAILQRKFRQHGFEWQCDGLDILPCDSVQFAELLYQPEKDLHA